MYFKQIGEIVRGEKTCTQRCMKMGESYRVAKDGTVSLVFTAKGRVKWSFGSDYAVSPKRGQRGLFVLWDHPVYPLLGAAINADGVKDLQRQGYQPLRICISKIELVKVQTVDERVAVAEGVKSVEEYIALWKTINKAKGTRWEDNPLVWRLWFEVTDAQRRAT